MANKQATKQAATKQIHKVLLVALLFPFGCAEDAAPKIVLDERAELRHVYVKPPPGSIPELFPEGGGLIRRMPAEEMNGQWGWWYAFLSARRIESLEGAGVSVMELGEIRRPDLPHVLEDTGASMECTNSPGTGEFCGYELSLARCNRTISEELDDAPTDYPPIAGKAYVELLDLGDSDLGTREIKALRIGKIWETGDPEVPQLVVFAAQHAREWVTSEFAMRLLRYYADSYKNNTNGVRTLLADRAIVIIPVANPDGYDYTHDSMGDRDWRPNRTSCSGGIGTDTNRNFAFSFAKPGAGSTCVNDENSQYRGGSAGDAAETDALLAALSNDGLSGDYVTRFALNAHSYGNVVIFPEGLSSGFTPCTTNSNCTAPDLGAFHELVGTVRSPWLTDEESDAPYIPGQIYRTLYAVSGDATKEHVYGTLPASAPRVIGAAVELTHTECGFHAELLPDSELDTLFGRFEDLVTQILTELPALDDGSFYSTYSFPHLHRRSPDGGSGLAEYPTIRVSVDKSFSTVAFPYSDGTGTQDDVIDGVAYRMWRFRPSTPYVFPTLVPVCAQGTNCAAIRLWDPGSGEVDLCDPNAFSAIDGFSFNGDTTGGPQDECFFEFDASGSGPPWELTTNSFSLASMTEARLVYSTRWDDDAVVARVIVSDNGFTSCSETGYGSCRIVRSYPFGTSNADLRTDPDYRTEILDISDFDGSTGVQVKVEVTSASTGGSPPYLDVYDVVVVGWD